MSKQRDKLKATSKKDEFSSTTWVEDQGYFDSNEWLEDDACISLDELREKESKGLFEDISLLNTTEKGLTTVIVDRALNKLPVFEREVIQRYYFQGQTCHEISKVLHKTSMIVNNVRITALNRLKAILVQEKARVGLTADFNRCILCNHEHCVSIDTTIHLYLDSHNWNYHGLHALLLKKFKLQDLSSDDIKTHVEYHMNIEDEAALLSKMKKEEAPKIIQLNVSVPKTVEQDIDSLCDEFTVAKSFVTRQAMVYGLKMLRQMLIMNEQWYQEQVKLTQLARKGLV